MSVPENDAGFMADSKLDPTDTATREVDVVPVATEGPWHRSDVRELGHYKIRAWVTNDDGHRWRKTICEMRDGNMDEGEAEANAALIIAAPRLLEVLREASAFYSRTSTGEDFAAGFDIDAVDAVIALAEGRQS